MKARLSFSSTKVPGGVVITLSGDFTVFEMPRLQLFIAQLLEDKVFQIVFDLGAIHFMDSSALVLLINLSKKVKKNGGLLGVANLSPAAREVLDLTHSYRILKVFPSVEQGVAAFALPSKE